MFTGIIELRANILSTEAQGTGLRMCLEAPSEGWDVVLGESVAVSGACLSIAEILSPAGEPQSIGGKGSRLAFDLTAETMERTWFDELAPGSVVNLERSLKIGDRLDGHLVSGHVDAVGEIVAISESGDGGRRIRFKVPADFERWLVDKGSVCIDGTSLTVCEPSAGCFEVAVIPITLEITNLGTAVVGQRVNLEADAIGKWVARLFPGAS